MERKHQTNPEPFIKGKGKANGDPNGKAGRESKYSPDLPERAYRLALLGLTDLEIAHAIGINKDTIISFKNNFPEFKMALFKGRAEADSKVAQALYHRAIGYKHKETICHVIDKEVIQTEVIKYYPPDTAACKIWLRNRTRKNDFVWSDSIQAEISGKDGGPIQTEQKITHELNLDFSQLSEDELKMCITLGLKTKESSEN